ncbi:MAG: NUDIX domain-containing protein [Clostridia bacterium]|nr:NUDIX domain-containing protein [Clostridia bacterium]MDD4387141.1 NUDIX domain-containing protein [Clostridia bacterium]
MKKYVVILLFNEDMSKILLMKRKKNPYIGLYNGIGGKIEENESVFECCLRETIEEINVHLMNPRLLVTCTYPESNKLHKNSNIELNVMYDITEESEFEENEEGTFEWLSTDFVLNTNNKLIAGYGNVGLFTREILELENKNDFYKV